MTTSPVDPNRVLFTGENPYIRLKETEDGPETTYASFWRLLFSPGGPGHALFLQSELTGDTPRVYSDNIAMTRWLQDEIERTVNATFGDLEIPVIESTCKSSGDMRSHWIETVSSRDEEIALTWYDLGEPFLMHTFPQKDPKVHGVCWVCVPAYGARLTVNGREARGRPFPDSRGDRKSSTCALAPVEVWLLPYE